MSSNRSHQVLHRMVPLICQAITTSEDESVWLDGLRLLANPKLRSALAITSSIWMPLLLKGLEASQPTSVNVAALNLLGETADQMKPMKSCFVKPLKLLARDGQVGSTEELEVALAKLDMQVDLPREVQMVADRPKSSVSSPATTPQMPLSPDGRDHPLLAEILARNLPPQTRTVRHAWNNTLFSVTYENSALWLRNLFQATLEASGTPELVINSRLGSLVHAELFQTAFLKCYMQVEGDAPFKGMTDQALIRLFFEAAVHKDIKLVLLDLIAFLNKEKLPLSDQVNDAAKHCALTSFKGDVNVTVPAIILWYAEREALEATTAQNLANLTEVNIRLGSLAYDSAWSTLHWRKDSFGEEADPIWITQLSHWNEALDAQDRQDGGQTIKNFNSFNTRMICHHALGQFDHAYDLAQNFFDGLNDNERSRTSHWAAAAAWHMGDYEAMADYLAFHPKGTSKSLYKAIIDVHSGQYASAYHHIGKAHSLAYDELQAQLHVGPSVAFKTLAKSEILVELNEVISYKSQPDMRDHILGVWRARFKRSHADPNSWLKRLQVWTLACPPTTPLLQHCYLDCAKLCEANGMREAAQSILELVKPDISPPGCKVEYTQLRFEWKDACTQQSTDEMLNIVSRLKTMMNQYMAHLKVDPVLLHNEGLGLRPLTALTGVNRVTQNLLARHYYRLAQWTEVNQGSGWLTDSNSEVYRYYCLSCKLDDAWFNAAFSLSQAAMSIFEANGHRRDDTVAVNNYGPTEAEADLVVVPALRALFLAIRSQETPEKLIRAILRLITLWFRYGESEAVLIEVEGQLVKTPTKAWLMAIPQLIARLGTKHKELQGLLIDLLKNIASRFPHAIIWPLFTASQTNKAEHQEAAREIMDYICTMSDGTRLVNQAQMVGKELIRSSFSWMARWRNILDHIIPKQEIMETVWEDVPTIWEEDFARLAVPETPDEEMFVQVFGPQLQFINKSLVKYKASRQLSLVNTAYSELYKLYGQISGQLNTWRSNTALQLADTAPRLLSLRDCILVVPGQYDPAMKLDDQAFIDGFHPVLDVLGSKQLPRKLIIRSYDKDFTFLLKGNEDLRGDERIMQLFNLINTLLNHHSEAFKRNLHLLPYEVIPLSPSAGLLSWVSNTQQLQSMVLANREKNNTNWLSNREMGSLLGYDPITFDPKVNPRIDGHAEMEQYGKLPIKTKMERLTNALSHSDQSDMKEMLWRRSPSAEIWIRRRTNFARTVGVGSFVGHVIGLGDRHGSNILVDQLTWGALHIDFGDLFGVAQERSYLPEQVPFRLTRMMTNVFEAGCQGDQVAKSRGNFKQASTITMEVLRDSRSALLAMLEAFLYDPLLSWTANGGLSDSKAAVSSSKSVAKGLSTKIAGNSVVPASMRHIPQSVVPPIRHGSIGNSNIYGQIGNSLLAPDSYMAKVSGMGMTNAKALQVLAQIEKKLAGYISGSDTPLPVKQQVEELIEEATDIRYLSQGYVLGWLPHW